MDVVLKCSKSTVTKWTNVMHHHLFNPSARDSILQNKTEPRKSFFVFQVKLAFPRRKYSSSPGKSEGGRLIISSLNTFLLFYMQFTAISTHTCLEMRSANILMGLPINLHDHCHVHISCLWDTKPLVLSFPRLNLLSITHLCLSQQAPWGVPLSLRENSFTTFSATAWEQLLLYTCHFQRPLRNLST